MAVTKRKRKPRPGQRSSYFQAEVYVSGIRVAFKAFETIGEASLWHDTTKKRFQQGRGPMGEMTLFEVCQEYRDLELATQVDQTQASKLLPLRHLERSPIAQVAMSEMSGLKVDIFLDWLIASPLAASKQRQSFMRELGLLRIVLGFYRDRIDDQFVCCVTKRHLKRARYKPVPKRRRDYFIPAEDAKRWLAALEVQQDPVYHAVALFQLVMGARVGEAAALCWDAVDLAKGLVEIRRTMEWTKSDGRSCRTPVERTKTTDSQRTLPLPTVIAELLSAARKRSPLSAEVFRNRAGDKLGYQGIAAAYNRGFKKAGLPWTATHICRHTNATLARSKLGTEDVSANLGHSTTRQTEAYMHRMEANGVPDAVAGMLSGGNHVGNHVGTESSSKTSMNTGRLTLVRRS